MSAVRTGAARWSRRDGRGDARSARRNAPLWRDGSSGAEIDALAPDIVLVGMGAPRQEMWMERAAPRLPHVGAMLAVGGLFDFQACEVARAPLWMRRRGLEWIWRLMMEPRRLAGRYLIGNPLFLLGLMGERPMRAPSLADFAPEALAARARAAESERRRLGGVYARAAFARRVLDVATAGTALVLLAPLLALIALLIKWESPGPALFIQERVGEGGRLFRMIKLRSMRADAEARKAELLRLNEMQGGVLFKMKSDPQVTRVGRFSRKYSIDESPQLWNVLRGDMSIVGPRPPLPSEVALYSSRDARRLTGRPGLTGLWQIEGRSALPFARQVELDVKLIAQASPWSDLKVMLRTIPAVLKGSGAY